MSTIHLPDPHPGRCLNHRSNGGDTVRCLDYENVQHVCEFPPFPVRTESGSYYSFSHASETRPWVKP